MNLQSASRDQDLQLMKFDSIVSRTRCKPDFQTDNDHVARSAEHKKAHRCHPRNQIPILEVWKVAHVCLKKVRPFLYQNWHQCRSLYSIQGVCLFLFSQYRSNSITSGLISTGRTSRELYTENVVEDNAGAVGPLGWGNADMTDVLSVVQLYYRRFSLSQGQCRRIRIIYSNIKMSPGPLPPPYCPHRRAHFSSFEFFIFGRFFLP